ncbi:MAG: zf-TFIIB domain-containing protein [Limisphaerales bacterium]
MDPTVHVDPQAKRRCPKCNVAMMRHYFNQLRGTHLDSCPQCGGNWLDAGELAQVRVEFRAQSARDAAKQQPVINKHLKWFVAEE